MTTTTCRSCGRTTTRPGGRWAPVIVKGETVGYTCPACPRHGEPIRRIENGAGVRYRVTLDAGITATGRRKQETKLLPTLAEARQHVVTRSAELMKTRSTGRPALDGKAKLREVAERWLAAKEGTVRKGSHEYYAHSLKPVLRYFGERRVEAISYADVEAFARWLVKEGGRNGRPLGHSSAKAALTALSQVLDRAVKIEEAVGANVAKGQSVPRAHTDEEDDDELERWTADQLLAFVAHADDDRLSAAWRLIALGMRREEVLGLRWGRVSFDKGTVTVARTRVPVSRSTDERGWTIGPPKSGASARTINPDDVLPGTMAALRKLYLASADKRGFVVTDEAGEPPQPYTFSRRFTALCKAAEVPSINVHSTRHSVAYVLHDAGVPPVRAAAFLGHELAVHLSTYLFAREDDVQVAGVALGQALTKVANGA